MENAKREKTLEELKEELVNAHQVYNQIQKLVQEREAKEREERQKRLADEKEARYKEIEKKTKELASLRKSFINDYGSLRLTVEANDSWWTDWELWF